MGRAELIALQRRDIEELLLERKVIGASETGEQEPVALTPSQERNRGLVRFLEKIKLAQSLAREDE